MTDQPTDQPINQPTLSSGMTPPDRYGARCYEPHPELKQKIGGVEPLCCLRPRGHDGRHETVKGGEWVRWVS